MKPKLLFLDDRTKRIHAALDRYSDEFRVTIVTNALEFLRIICKEDFDVWSMDNDLGGRDFLDPENPDTGYHIVRFIEKFGWPEGKKKPEVVIHSSNLIAANRMGAVLRSMGFKCTFDPFFCPPEKQYAVGFVAGAFDILHPGYIALFRDAKRICEYLIVGLHVDPSLENPQKPVPVLSLDERAATLLALRHVDEVRAYATSKDLLELLTEIHPDVRILGSDYESHPEDIIGGSFNIPIYYHQRNHNWSSTKLKRDIAASQGDGRKS